MRLPANAAEKLHRAAEETGLRKKDIVASLLSKHLGEPMQPVQTMGSYSFHPYDEPSPPEVMGPEQVAHFLKSDVATVIEMAEAGNLPGRKLGKDWRFSRAALMAWLSGPEKR